MTQLTDRELEVFELIGRGRSTREISNQLHLGVSTVGYLSRADQNEIAFGELQPALP